MRLLASLVFFQSVIAQQFLSVDILPAPLIEWDQQPSTYYTGQTMNTTWTSQGFAAADQLRITYPGVGGVRTVTAGTLIQPGFFATRLSDSSNGVATGVPLTVAFTTNTAIAKNSNQNLSVIQSKLMNLVPRDGNRTLGGGQNTVCDDRNLTISWRGLGEAQFGVASISLSKVSGSPGTLGTALSNVPVSGNMTVPFLCPRNSVPSTFSAYAFQISVQEPGGAAYTGTSASFMVGVAPTPTPTPTQTPSGTPTISQTPSITPTISQTGSGTPTISQTPSNSQSPTPSGTPSQTPTVSYSATPSTTETARPSIDYLAIGKAAAAQVDTTTPAVAGALGGIGGILVLLGAGKWYQKKVLTERRKQKQAMTSRFVHDVNRVYGISTTAQEEAGPQPGVVMYTVQGLSPQRASLASYKKSFPPNVASK